MNDLYSWNVFRVLDTTTFFSFLARKGPLPVLFAYWFPEGKDNDQCGLLHWLVLNNVDDTLSVLVIPQDSQDCARESKQYPKNVLL